MAVINHRVDPLDEVAKQFEQWRATRGKKGPIPDAFWTLVSPLVKQYNPSKIAQALGVNCHRLRQGLSTVPPSLTQSMTLVECSPHPVLPIPECQGVTLAFSCKNGRPVTLNGLQGTDISAAIASLVRG